MKELMKKVVAVLLMTVVFATSVFVMDNGKAGAVVVYITVEEFSENLSKELGITQVEGDAKSGYVNALIEAGIIKNGDFTKYTGYLTRTDMAVLLNRADEYLNGDTLEADLVTLALNERISDIKKIAESKQTDVVKAYLKGFIIGYSNGTYSTDREFKGGSKISKTGALACIKMLKDTSLRAKISPDGQLIRTTDLPKNASKFAYILASYPNSYYEWKLMYEGSGFVGDNGEHIALVRYVDYAPPVTIDKLNSKYYKNIAEIRIVYLNEWVKKAKRHLELIFSADYRTMDQTWQDEVMATSYAIGTAYEWFPKKKLDSYVSGMNENKTIVEYSKIAVDGSTLYYFNEVFYMRVYVKYRVVSSLLPVSISTDELIVNRPYNNVLLSNDLVYMKGIIQGQWVEGYYDIALDETTGSIKDLGVLGVLISPGRIY